jgi:cobyrinic acid a,c-diamide synthase
MIASPASGHGKTTVATGLMAALALRGLRVSPHKVGPDYIDPGYHALAAGRPGRNLDAFLCGASRIVPLFLHGARGTEIAVVEGVMGLFDGAANRGDEASTAHVAKLLDAPVVMVVDASAQGWSVAALLHGFMTYDPAVRIGGVILNRVASDRHEQILREAAATVGVPVLGALRREDRAATPSRHLGLVPAAERSAEAVATVTALGRLVAAHCDLEALLRLAGSAPPLSADPWDPHTAVASEQGEAIGHPSSDARAGTAVASEQEGAIGHASSDAGAGRVALAAGRAFTFSYAETAELLTAAGAEVVPVDPLRDEVLPDGTQALVVGGGFPEMYAAELAANERLRKDVADLAASGGVVAAECAGLLYLARSLDGAPMCGVLDVEARMTGRLVLGYREAVAASDSALLRGGEAVRGHEFHRTACRPAAGAVPAWTWDGGRREGFVHSRVHASYLHLHWAGYPHLARRLVEAVTR